MDAYLDAHPGIRMVSVVHSETPSGTLNPVREIGPIAAPHGAVTIVDCVSSFGGIELQAEAWQLDLLVAGSAEVPRWAARDVAHGGQPGGLGAIDANPARAA